MANLLVIDDDPLFSDLMENQLHALGHDCETASTLYEGLRRAAKRYYDIIFLDVNLPDGNGLSELANFRLSPSTPEIVIVTGNGDPEGAELAIRNGAWDYIQKPPTANTVELLVSRALKYRLSRLSAQEKRSLDLKSLVGESQRFKGAIDALAHAALSNGNVLITGETGTGKELFARAIHENSQRAGHPFIIVDCTSIPDTLAESILFGHRKGAFTGAVADKPGLFSQADGGSVFLDEIGDLSLSIQKSLLRVLQERRFRPIGAKTEQASNFRLIAATNRDLRRMVDEGAFRKDLFFRLRAMSVELPPLRDRQNDITLLARHYVPVLAKEAGAGPKKITKDYLDALYSYSWPGNVRELLNVLGTSVGNARGEDSLYPHHLPVEIRAQLIRSTMKEQEQEKRELGQAACIPEHLFDEDDLPKYRELRRKTLERMETVYLKAVVRLCDKNSVKACRISGLSRARLYELLQKHNLRLKR